MSSVENRRWMRRESWVYCSSSLSDLVVTSKSEKMAVVVWRAMSWLGNYS